MQIDWLRNFTDLKQGPLFAHEGIIEAQLNSLTTLEYLPNDDWHEFYYCQHCFLWCHG